MFLVSGKFCCMITEAVMTLVITNDGQSLCSFVLLLHFSSLFSQQTPYQALKILRI